MKRCIACSTVVGVLLGVLIATVTQPAFAARRRDEPGEEVTVIERYRRLLAKCDEQPTERCPAIKFDLARLYYDSAQSAFVEATRAYEAEMERREKRRHGAPPVRPVPDYSRAARLYTRLVSEHPAFTRNDAAYYMLGNIHTLHGDLTASRRSFKAIITRHPSSRFASLAHLREADFCYMDGDHTAGLRHLKQVKRDEVDTDMWEMAVYRTAEHYYSLAEFDRAAAQFFAYLEACAAGEFPKQQFRAEAIQNLAAVFADMPDGAGALRTFFDRHGTRPYEAQVAYLVGTKNKDHGQYERAGQALEAALERFPYYPGAPAAHRDLIDCLLVLKQHERANQERMRLVERFDAGSEWHDRNRRDDAAMDQARAAVRETLRDACLYLHYWAVKRKEAGLYSQACAAYERYLATYADDPWQVYELTHNLAELYAATGRKRDAVEHYWRIATEDLSSYPTQPVRAGQSASHGTDAERQRAAAVHDNRPAFTQADAGWNAIVLLDQLRTRVAALDNLEPPEAYHLPVTQQLLKYARMYGRFFPQDSLTSSVVYLAARTHYEGRAFAEATKDLWFLIENWPAERIVIDARRLLGDIYVSAGEFDNAIAEYRVILARTDLDSRLRNDITRLAAAALYGKADAFRSRGSEIHAARVFLSIPEEYPDPHIAERAWFEAGVCYEQVQRHERAAEVFEEFSQRFPTSVLREKAYYRAAESYKTVQDWLRAGEVYLAAANGIRRADYAIPSLASAAEMFARSGALEKAGRIHLEVYRRYPGDSRSALALYNAGVTFDKAEEPSKALHAYRTLLDAFPSHDYACDAAYASGECLEALQRWAEAGKAFELVAGTKGCGLTGLQALVRAGTVYRTAGMQAEAMRAYKAAVALRDRIEDTEAAAAELGGEAHYYLGRAWQARSEAVALTGRNPAQVRARLNEREKALGEALKNYSQAIKTGVSDWVLRSNLAMSDAFLGLADGVRGQQLFAVTQTERIALRAQVKLGLDQYYTAAIEKQLWNIRTAQAQGLSGALVDSSVEAFIATVIRHGDELKQASDMLLTAPLPALSPEEQRVYRDMVEEKSLAIGDEAVKRYDAGPRAARELGLERRLVRRIETAIFDVNPGYLGSVAEHRDDSAAPMSDPLIIDTLFRGDSLFWKGDTANN